jgi:hypothetical protein
MTDRGASDDMNDQMPAVVASAVARLTPPTTATPAQVGRVMDAVRGRHAANRRRRMTLTTAAIAAVLLIGVSLTWRTMNRAIPAGQSAPAQTTVQFELVAPGARQLALVGDFNSWDAHATPMTRNPATGAWVVNVPLSEGRYLYAFVADGNRWLADPHAPLASTDDFSRPNSVLVVSTQLASATLP